MNGIKRVAVLGLTACMVISLAGCNFGKEEGPTKEELIADNAAYSSLIDQQVAQIAELESTIKAMTGSEGPTTAISAVGDGSDKLGFNSMAGKLLFPVAFEYPGAQQAPVASKIQIDAGTYLSPSSNWVVNINGTTSEYSHSFGINGIVKVAALTERKSNEDIKTEMIDPFIAAIPTTSSTSTKIFFNDSELGVMYTLGTTVDNQEGILKLAVFATSSRAITFCFFYPGASDTTKNELVDSMIKSLQLGEQFIVME